MMLNSLNVLSVTYKHLQISWAVKFTEFQRNSSIQMVTMRTLLDRERARRRHDLNIVRKMARLLSIDVLLGLKIISLTSNWEQRRKKCSLGLGLEGDFWQDFCPNKIQSTVVKISAERFHNKSMVNVVVYD